MNHESSDNLKATRNRLRVAIRGAVQGVGFRPFIYRLASELGLPGWVSNTPQGVFIEVEGEATVLGSFLCRLPREIPPRAFIQSLDYSYLDPVGYAFFEIRESVVEGEISALVLPDIATCPECLRDISDPENRRYRYPFTNCTNCGPRFSIIEGLPYDRPFTSMKSFRMCPSCEKEYHDPTDRRFHAQPIACPACGPKLSAWRRIEANSLKMQRLGSENGALDLAVDAIRNGEIVAVKGLGGFHLVVDARNDSAVRRLRERKGREEKPFAMMVPDLETAVKLCEVSEADERLLRSPEAPIVILKILGNQSPITNHQSLIAPSVSPSNPFLGLMLPYTPLHHLLMSELGFPVVATSGNVADEPICIDEQEAFERLGGIADAFLVHDRPIVRHVDDSVVRVMSGRDQVIRRARGYAPLPVEIASSGRAPIVLALGPHLKNTVVLAANGNAFVSQHIGDLETAESLDAFRRVSKDLQDLFGSHAELIACDLHPEYLSSKEARDWKKSIVEVQHHHAHILSCMAENQISGEVLGVAWDGTGYGPDGTIWGGEFLRVNGAEFERVAHFRKFRLPGGDAAVREPRRSALGVLEEMADDRIQNSEYGIQESRDERSASLLEEAIQDLDFAEQDQKLLHQMLVKGINSPWTSSVGRLFDAVAAILGIRRSVRHEGQAAMELEWSAEKWREDLNGKTREEGRVRIGEADGQRNRGGDASYAMRFVDRSTAPGPLVIDWSPMIRAILHDRQRGDDIGSISFKFHQALIESIVEMAKRVGIERVVLSGGCFQNVLLTERTIVRLREEGFRSYWHQRVPTNDGGIALGQAYAAILRSAGPTP